MKQVNNVWLPDTETHMIPQIDQTGGFDLGHYRRALSNLQAIHGQQRRAIDCGAHVGTWTRAMLRDFEQVCAFEPDPENFACLCKNLEMYTKNTTGNVIDDLTSEGRCGLALKFNCGLSDKPGYGSMRKHDRYGDSNTGGYWIDINADSAKIRFSTVSLMTLDSLLYQDVDFIKIDAEGMEPYIIHGAKKTLARCKPIVVWEDKPQFAERYGWDLEKQNPGRLLTQIGARRLDRIGKDEIWGWAA